MPSKLPDDYQNRIMTNEKIYDSMSELLKDVERPIGIEALEKRCANAEVPLWTAENPEPLVPDPLEGDLE